MYIYSGNNLDAGSVGSHASMTSKPNNINNGGANSGWKSSWWNSEGPWHDWSGSIYKAQYGNLSMQAGALHFGLFNITNSGLEVITIQLDLFTVDYDITSKINIGGTIGTGTAYVGFDLEKGVGVELKAVAATGGIQIGYLTVEGYAGGVGFTAMYQDGSVIFGGIAVFGGSVSVNVIEYINYITNPIEYIVKCLK